MAEKVAVPFIHNNGKLELAVSLARSQREECRPISFTLEKKLPYLSSGEHQVCINYVERSLAPNNWIICGNILTAEKPFMAKGICSTESTLLLGRWNEFFPCQTKSEIEIPDQVSFNIVKGPAKFDFFTSLFGHEGHPSRITNFTILDENGKSRLCECMITAIERSMFLPGSLFKTKIRFKANERYIHAIGYYSTKKTADNGKLHLI